MQKKIGKSTLQDLTFIVISYRLWSNKLKNVLLNEPLTKSLMQCEQIICIFFIITMSFQFSQFLKVYDAGFGVVICINFISLQCTNIFKSPDIIETRKYITG